MKALNYIGTAIAVVFVLPLLAAAFYLVIASTVDILRALL